MVENPVFDLKLKHVPSVYGCGDEQFVVFGILYNSFKNKYCHIDAQEGVIVQITHCVILKYVKKCNPPMFFKCNISVKHRYACIYEQFIFLSSFVFAHLDTAQLHVLLRFSASYLSVMQDLHTGASQ